MIMEDNWEKVYEDDDRHMVEILKAKLRAEGIVPVSITENDRNFPSIGESEIYVVKADAEKAREIIRRDGNE